MYFFILTQHIGLTPYLGHEIVLWQIQKLMLLYRYCFVSLCISKYKPPEGLYSEGRFNGGFFALRVLGAYTWRGLFSKFYGISEEERCVTTLSADKGPVPERLISNITPEVKF